MACPLPGVPVAHRVLCCHTGTAGLAECPTFGASKPLCLPKYQKKEMKCAPGESVWAPRREEKCAGRTARAVLSPPFFSIEMCLSLPIPCLSPFLLKHFGVFPTSQGLSKAVGRGTAMKRGC